MHSAPTIADTIPGLIVVTGEAVLETHPASPQGAYKCPSLRH